MKKLMFTAIALVAFSGVSMANTKQNKKIIRKIDCECLRESTYYNAINNGANTQQAFYIAQATYNSCRVANL